MAETNNGSLSKLQIKAYSDPEFQNEVTNLPGGNDFVTLVNPEKYSSVFKVGYNNDQPQGSSKIDLKYTRTLPEDLELEFLFDRTGIFKDYPETNLTSSLENNNNAKTAKETGVDADLVKFKAIVLNYNGTEHKPNYLKIIWGSLLFEGVLTDLNVEYKLFGSDGKPLRAIAKAKFKTFTAAAKQIAEENKNSPDLTHARVVIEGDTLPLMTSRVYGDSKYYLEVARVNKLTSFRKLVAGQQIIFPPIQKPS
ncbi:MAG: LysM peptidoglycan-binding domain-containing protein [Flavobacteriales bacterium]|nr:LysM peptidoglycan-binding domain-containing protein [Flavobacteriales bacterium]